MIILRLGQWSHAAGLFFTYTRVYWGGRWTPFCRVKKRYPSWFGYWQNPLERH